MTDPTNPHPLRLRAVDQADLAVIAAMLQDALLPVMDIAFQPAENRFVAVANRYRWENKAEPERVLCAIRLDHARAARAKGIDRTDRGKILNLLSISLRDSPDGPRVAFIFAGGAEIEVAVDALAMTIEDQGEPWPALSTPKHEEGAGS